MKIQDKISNKPGSPLEYRNTSTEAGDFHAKRMRREGKIEARKESSSKPEGNDEYEQLVAEDASFNTRPMIAEAAFFLSERHGFSPGNELSDWLQAEDDVEKLLRGKAIVERRAGTRPDRRESANLSG